jgi:transposase
VRQKEPLRTVSEDERAVLVHLSRSAREAAAVVARAKALLAVADGASYTAAAQAAGRRSGDALARLVARFNAEGLDALVPRHGGGHPALYSSAERERILSEARRRPEHERDGTATWSLVTLQRALRRATDGHRRLAAGERLHHLVRAQRRRLDVAAHAHLVSDRHGCAQTQARNRHGPRRGQRGKKGLIEQAYREAETNGVALACEDEAGPFQTVPYPGSSWELVGHPVRQPHDYVRNGTAKLLTLLRPATGQVQVKGVTACPTVVLHAWLNAEVSALLARLPEPVPIVDPEAPRAQWTHWQEGVTIKITLPAVVPPLRLLLVWDTLKGHHPPELMLWLFARGVSPWRNGALHALSGASGSWLTMAESIQRILGRRALEGQHPQTPEQIIEWLEATARGWHAHPTPFVWGGKRAARRVRARERRQALAGSGACVARSLRHPKVGITQHHWPTTTWLEPTSQTRR